MKKDRFRYLANALADLATASQLESDEVAEQTLKLHFRESQLQIVKLSAGNSHIVKLLLILANVLNVFNFIE